MAIFGETDITPALVGSALDSRSSDVGTLCTHPNINVWSKWKPINSSIVSMTIDELRLKNYGVKILQANTIEELVRKINSSLGIGYAYDRPKTAFRLGDFRHYDSYAPLPCDKTYTDAEEIRIGGVMTDNHAMFERTCKSIEAHSTETTIGVDDIYNLSDEFGNKVELRRGCYITDGTNSVWYTDRFYWWTTEMQRFAGKEVTIYEFYTNVIRGSDGIIRHPGSESIDPWDTDRFLAIPYPRYKKKIIKDTPTGSRLVATILSARFTAPLGSDSKLSKITYGVYFDATGDDCRGGTIRDVYIKLCRDRDGNHVIGAAVKLADELTVPNNTVSKRFIGSFNNMPEGPDKPLSRNVWVVVWYNARVQAQMVPLAESKEVSE